MLFRSVDGERQGLAADRDGKRPVLHARRAVVRDVDLEDDRVVRLAGDRDLPGLRGDRHRPVAGQQRIGRVAGVVIGRQFHVTELVELRRQSRVAGEGKRQRRGVGLPAQADLEGDVLVARAEQPDALPGGGDGLFLPIRVFGQARSGSDDAGAKPCWTGKRFHGPDDRVQKIPFEKICHGHGRSRGVR